jgi:hypothetical protein
MGDIFNEQLVAKSNSLKDNLIRLAIIIGAIVLIMICSMIPVLLGFLFPIAIAIIFGAFFLIRKLNIEFEYVFTSGDLDNDKIFNKNKRKKFISIDVRKIEIMAPINSKDHASELSNYEKVIDCSSGTNSNNTYAAMIVRDGKREKLIIEPNEKMLNGIKRYIPSKVKQY